MKTLIRTLVLGVTLCGAFTATAAKYAICVGIDKYTLAGCSTLQGSETDAKNMASLLTGKGGWPSGNVTKLINNYATRSTIVNTINTLAGKAVSGDVVVYYQSSHGGGDDNAYLCCYDATLSGADMGAALRKFASGVKVVCVIDTCCSGGLANKGVQDGNFVKAFIEEASAVVDQSNGSEKGAAKITNAQIGWCAACMARQTSLYCSESAGGYFTSVFVASARTGACDVTDVKKPSGNGDGNCSAYEAFCYAYNQLYWYPWVDNYGNTGDDDQHIPVIANESVCKEVTLATVTHVDTKTAANETPFSFTENYGYEWQDSYNEFTSGGWHGQKDLAYNGGSALRSAPVLPGVSSCISMKITGPGKLTFRWRTSCLANGSYLSFYVDGDEENAQTITGLSTGWAEYSKTFSDNAQHTVTWDYFRNEDEVAGEDCGYVDAITWTGSSSGGMNAALDNVNLTFGQVASASGVPQWKTTTEIGYGGSALLCSGLANGQYSCVETTVTGPCVVDWQWACIGQNGVIGAFVSGQESAIDTIQNTGTLTISGVILPEGEHTITWMYAQIGAVGSGDGVAVLDWVGVYYPVSFDLNGGSGSIQIESAPYTDQDDTPYYEVGTNITLPSGSGLSSSTGQEFQGWTYEGVGYEPEASFTIPMRPVEFVASWGSISGRDTFMLGYSSSGMFQGKGTYNGYVLEGDDSNWACGAVIGTVQVKTSKMKGGSSPVTVSLTLAGLKQAIKLKGNTSWSSQYVDLGTATLAGSGCVVKLNLTHKNTWGYIYLSDGNSYFFDSARTDDAGLLSRLNGAKGNYKVACFSYPYSGMTKLGESFIGVSAQVGSKGKTKLTGVLPDLSKLSGTTYAVADDTGVYLPFFTKINAKKGSFGGYLLSLADVQPVLNVDGQWDGTGSKTPVKALLGFEASERAGNAPRETWYMFETFGTIPNPYDNTSVLLDEFPGWTTLEYLTFSKKTWTQRLADYKKMKLSFTPKTGLVKGSFKFLLASGAKPKATVNGIYISKHSNFIDGLVPCSVSVKGKMALYAILQ